MRAPTDAPCDLREILTCDHNALPMTLMQRTLTDHISQKLCAYTGLFEYILITERSLFFEIVNPQRYLNIIFFNVPFFVDHFFMLIDNLLFNEEEKNQVFFLFSKKDAFDLERIIGTNKCINFITERNKFKKFELD